MQTIIYETVSSFELT